MACPVCALRAARVDNSPSYDACAPSAQSYRSRLREYRLIPWGPSGPDRRDPTRSEASSRTPKIRRTGPMGPSALGTIPRLRRHS